MRDKSHNEQVERWARFVRDNPNSWKGEHTAFINSQITIADRFYSRLEEVPDGKEKIRKLRHLA